MRHISRRHLCGAMLTALPLATLGQAPYPNKPLVLVVPAGAGGGTDALARFIGNGIAPLLGQPVVVDNKPGANGVIGTQAVARAEGDGYTMMVADVSAISINPALIRKMPYDATRDLVPVSIAARLPLMMVTGASSPYDSIEALVRQGKSRQLSVGNSGVGNITHLASAMFARESGIEVTHVPYKGAPPLLADVIAGTLDAAMTSVPSATEMIKAGRLRGLALTGGRRMAQVGDTPTLQELGYKGFDVGSWIAVHVPGTTPAAVVAQLHHAVDRLLVSKEGREWLAAKGYELVNMAPQQARSYTADETSRFAQVIRDARIEQN